MYKDMTNQQLALLRYVLGILMTYFSYIENCRKWFCAL